MQLPVLPLASPVDNQYDCGMEQQLAYQLEDQQAGHLDDQLADQLAEEFDVSPEEKAHLTKVMNSWKNMELTVSGSLSPNHAGRSKAAGPAGTVQAGRPPRPPKPSKPDKSPRFVRKSDSITDKTSEQDEMTDSDVDEFTQVAERVSVLYAVIVILDRANV